MKIRLALFAVLLLVGIAIGVGQIPNMPKPASFPIAKREPHGRDSSPKSTPLQPPAASKDRASVLLENLNNDRLCETARSLETDRSFDSQTLSILRQVYSDPGEFAELVANVSPFFDLDQDYQSKPGRFVQALRLAQLIDPLNESEKPNLQRSHEILLQLSQEDPQNAAYPYFRLAVESRLGFSEEVLARTVFEASRGQTFDSHLNQFARLLRQRYWENSSYNLFLASVISRMPWPNYLPSETVLQRLLERDPNSVVRLGELMVLQGTRAERGFQSFGFDVMQYETGRRYVNRELPSFPELSKQIERRQELWEDGYTIDTVDCDSKQFLDAFQRLRNRY